MGNLILIGIYLKNIITFYYNTLNTYKFKQVCADNILKT